MKSLKLRNGVEIPLSGVTRTCVQLMTLGAVAQLSEFYASLLNTCKQCWLWFPCAHTHTHTHTHTNTIMYVLIFAQIYTLKGLYMLPIKALNTLCMQCLFTLCQSYILQLFWRSDCSEQEVRLALFGVLTYQYTHVQGWRAICACICTC